MVCWTTLNRIRWFSTVVSKRLYSQVLDGTSVPGSSRLELPVKWWRLQRLKNRWREHRLRSQLENLSNESWQKRTAFKTAFSESKLSFRFWYEIWCAKCLKLLLISLADRKLIANSQPVTWGCLLPGVACYLWAVAGWFADSYGRVQIATTYENEQIICLWRAHVQTMPKDSF